VSGNYAYLANGSDGLRIYLLQPQLSIISDTDNNLIITWPAPSTLYVLQEDSTGNGDWVDITTVPTVVAGQNQVIIPQQPSGSTNFRLAIVQPQLTMAIDSTGITLSWPAYFAGFVPQQIDNPSGTNWITINNTQFTVASQHQVHVRQTAPNQFFRLISQ
jgi:hypothetical protein